MSLVTDFILGGGGAAPGSPEVLEDRGGARHCLVLPKRAGQVQLKRPQPAPSSGPMSYHWGTDPRREHRKCGAKRDVHLGLRRGQGQKELGLEGR